MAALSRLAMWSGPRNISTALMRSWENRPDTVVVDEPFYPHYLEVTGVDHPGRAEILAAGEAGWRSVRAALLAPVPGARVFYQKHMAHHLTPDIERDWIQHLTNVLLIRDPREVVSSYLRSRETVAVDDIGLRQQNLLYDDLAAAGLTPLVIDAADFLREPAAYLKGLCRLVGIDFDDRMLSWPAGPRDTDGIWAPYWYAAVQASTGFAPYRPRDVTLHGEGAVVAETCAPLYERLFAERWQA
jgi:hypothetical protein